jgi:succinate dehydrogenase / fumarate reductase cytochrome b subunit
MSETATTPAKKRPEFRNINAFTDLPTYRLPAAGWVSILHRVSGVMMFALMPFIIWMFDTSISSDIWKLLALGLIWAYLHHFTAGLRHLWMDISHKAVELQFGKSSAKVVLTISLTLTALLGAKLFGLY